MSNQEGKNQRENSGQSMDKTFEDTLKEKVFDLRNYTGFKKKDHWVFLYMNWYNTIEHNKINPQLSNNFQD